MVKSLVREILLSLTSLMLYVVLVIMHYLIISIYITQPINMASISTYKLEQSINN